MDGKEAGAVYLHLGQSVVVPHSQILGVFDLDNASWAYKTREYLERAEQAGRVVWLGDDLPRSFVVVGGEAHDLYFPALPRNPAEAGGGEPV